MSTSTLACLSAALLAALVVPPASAQTLRADGPPVQVLAESQPVAHASWSPDGARLAFSRPDYSGLWTVSADGNDVRLVTEAVGAGFGAAWSPDGTRLLARVSRMEGPHRFSSVAVFDVETGEAQALTEERRQMPGLPQWAGTGLVVLPSEGVVQTLSAPALSGSEAEASAPTQTLVFATEGFIGLAEPSGGAVRTVRPLAGDPLDGSMILNATPSPDGQYVAFEVLGGGLYVARTDGTGRIALGQGNRPSWSPDGRWLVVMVTEDDGHDITSSDLVAIRADGSARVALTRTTDRLEMNPAWSPDGTRIAYDDMTDGALYILPVRE